jgi:hypothetical protein
MALVLRPRLSHGRGLFLCRRSADRRLLLRVHARRGLLDPDTTRPLPIGVRRQTPKPPLTPARLPSRLGRG